MRMTSICKSLFVILALVIALPSFGQGRPGGRPRTPPQAPAPAPDETAPAQDPPSAAPAPAPEPAPAPPPETREVRQALYDKNWKIAPDMMEGLPLPASPETPVRLRITVEGVANYGKGFVVRIIPAKVWQDYLSGKATKKAFSDFPAKFVGEYHEIREFAPGTRWALVVENSQNLMKSMTVRVQLRLADRPGR